MIERTRQVDDRQLDGVDAAKTPSDQAHRAGLVRRRQ